LEHPDTGEVMEWEVPLPEDMEELLDQIDEASDGVA
jgi:23S rRNA pseudouridine1911/1915/1917 synthase